MTFGAANHRYASNRRSEDALDIHGSARRKTSNQINEENSLFDSQARYNIADESLNREFNIREMNNLEYISQTTSQAYRYEDDKISFNKISKIERDFENERSKGDFNKQLIASLSPEDRLHYLAITSIVPEFKLISVSDDEALFQSNLKKYSSHILNNHASNIFCDRFAVCTKTAIMLYKSKEQFLKQTKPVNVFQFSKIKSVNRLNLNYNNSKLFFFAIDLNHIQEEIRFKSKYLFN
jgi:hypothetical protein